MKTFQSMIFAYAFMLMLSVFIIAVEKRDFLITLISSILTGISATLFTRSVKNWD